MKKDSEMAPSVPEPAPLPPATARPDGSGYEWPSPIRQVHAAFRGHPYRQDGLLAFCYPAAQPHLADE
jgi:hypothetical protein